MTEAGGMGAGRSMGSPPPNDQDRSDTTTLRPLLGQPLPFGELHFHQPQYREFICSKSTAGWLMGGAMQKVNGRTVTLRIKEQFPAGNVAVGYDFKETPNAE